MKDFISVHSIVCPHCNVKQTGVIRLYNIHSLEVIQFNNDPIINPDEQFAIRCSWSKCAKLITGDELEKVTRKSVKSPSKF